MRPPLSPPALSPATPTFAVGDTSGAIEVSAGVARAGDTVVLPELGLVAAHRAANAAVCGSVVVVARGAVHCRWGHTMRVWCTRPWHGGGNHPALPCDLPHPKAFPSMRSGQSGD